MERLCAPFTYKGQGMRARARAKGMTLAYGSPIHGSPIPAHFVSKGPSGLQWGWYIMYSYPLWEPTCRLSSMVEHPPCKRKVMSSSLLAGTMSSCNGYEGLMNLSSSKINR